MAASRKAAPAAKKTEQQEPKVDEQPKRDEAANADNAMINEHGDRFLPDSSADALIFNADHGAMPEHPDRWPWPGVLVGEDPEAADQEDAEVEPEAVLPAQADLLGYCPTRDVCFPYGQPENAHHVSCVHGEAFADTADS